MSILDQIKKIDARLDSYDSTEIPEELCKYFLEHIKEKKVKAGRVGDNLWLRSKLRVRPT